MKKYTTSGCIDIVEAAYKKCLSKPRDKDEVKTRLKFVKDGALFLAYCIVTEQDPDNLKRLAVLRNHKFLKEM